MKQFDYIISEEVGIHARPAVLLVKAVKKYESSIMIERNGHKADAGRLIALMALGVKYGEKVTFSIEGADEAVAVKEIEAFCIKNL